MIIKFALKKEPLMVMDGWNMRILWLGIKTILLMIINLLPIAKINVNTNYNNKINIS